MVVIIVNSQNEFLGWLGRMSDDRIQQLGGNPKIKLKMKSLGGMYNPNFLGFIFVDYVFELMILRSTVIGRATWIVLLSSCHLVNTIRIRWRLMASLPQESIHQRALYQLARRH